jgi:hypothetical protein
MADGIGSKISTANLQIHGISDIEETVEINEVEGQNKPNTAGGKQLNAGHTTFKEIDSPS